MMHIKVNGKSAKIPTGYDDLTFGEYEQLLAASDFYELVKIALKLPEDKEAQLDLSGTAILTRALKFLKEQPIELPPNIKNLEGLPIGAFKDVQAILEKKEGATERVKWMVAIYEQWKDSPPYDFSKVPDYVAKVENTPCLEVLGKASFFLTKLTVLNGGTVRTVGVWNLLLRKLWRVLTRWGDSVSLIYYLLYVKISVRIARAF